MFILVNQQEIENVIPLLKKGVAQRPTHPILTNIRLKLEDDNQLRLIATDLAVCIQVLIPTEKVIKEEDSESFDILVDATSFLGFCNQQSGLMELNFKSDPDVDTQLKIAIGKGKFSFPIADSSQYPDMYFGNDDVLEIVLETEELLNTIDRVKYTASNQETKPVLQGVSLKKSGNQNWNENEEAEAVIVIEACATDGHRLAIESFTVTEISEFPDLILPSSLIDVIKLLKGKEPTVNLSYSNEEKEIKFTTSNVTIIGSIIQGFYPAYETLIPSNFDCSCIVNREDLKNAIISVSSFISKSAPSETIVLQFDSNNNEIIVNLATQERGQGSVSISCSNLTENTPEINLQQKYLKEALNQFTSEEVIIYVNLSPSKNYTEKPVIISPLGGNNYKRQSALVMPKTGVKY